MSGQSGGLEIAEFGAGLGTPILLLHEGLSSVAMWRDFPTKLADATGRKVIAWSRNGYGRSVLLNSQYRVDFMHREADVAAQVFDQLGIEKAHIFGHSDGASISLLLAARHPRTVESLVLEAPHVFVEPICLKAIARLNGDVARHDLANRLNKYHCQPDIVLDRWLSIWLDTAFASWSIDADIAGIKVPVLLIQGDEDEYGTFEQLDQISTRLPQAEQLRLSECGHSPHRDRAPDVLGAATRFLAAVQSNLDLKGVIA